MSRLTSAAERAGDAPTQLRVRPYLLTGGRTQSEIELNLETMLRTTEFGDSSSDELNLEPADIVLLCAEPISLAELAARLELPLQVTRVLVGDLVTDGLLQIQPSAEFASERPDLNLLERVLDGLQSL